MRGSYLKYGVEMDDIVRVQLAQNKTSIAELKQLLGQLDAGIKVKYYTVEGAPIQTVRHEASKQQA